MKKIEDEFIGCSRKTSNKSFSEILNNLNNFADDLSKVKSKTELPERTFLKKAEGIKKTILENAKDKQHAIKMINFYINRAGDKLENKTEVMKAKDLIENCHEFSDINKVENSLVIKSSDDNFSELNKRLDMITLNFALCAHATKKEIDYNLIYGIARKYGKDYAIKFVKNSYMSDKKKKDLLEKLDKVDIQLEPAS